jgi:hypothetical protein
MQVLIIYLQYNFIASKLPLNWPSGLINFVGGIQIFFTSGEGIFSLDCLLQVLQAFCACCCSFIVLSRGTAGCPLQSAGPGLGIA